ncbi:MAG TPA: ABC transporter transmembrane domain-containing protein, partial [Rugosimonospora sp.]|nr:ABC transporter transmembrane domain-containing protein [Rugosimonospora sp.]
MIGMLSAALLATGAGIVVPLVVQKVVDGPVHGRNPAGLVELGGLVLALGVTEAVLIFIRRWTQSAVALGMEYTMRNDLYAHLQRLPVAFHDQWQSGQLLSRATTDLSIIRRFLSFGLIFLVVNIATFITVAALLLRLYWPLGLVVVVSAVPLYLVSRSFT